MKTRLNIQLLGSSFSIQTEESAEHLEEVLSILNKKMEEVRDRNPGIEPIKIALLAALNITDELVHLKQNGEPSRQVSPESPAEIEKIAVIDTIAKTLIEKIDSVLDVEGE